MQFCSETRLHFPVHQVFVAYRDRLPDMAAFVSDLASVSVVSREEEGDRVVLHNRWTSERAVPPIARRVVGDDAVRWEDHAVWVESEACCDWHVRSDLLGDAIRCAGRTELVDEGDSTRVVVRGEVTVALDDVPGVPSFLAKRLAPELESWVISRILPNIQRSSTVVGRFLEAP